MCVCVLDQCTFTLSRCTNYNNEYICGGGATFVLNIERNRNHTRIHEAYTHYRNQTSVIYAHVYNGNKLITLLAFMYKLKTQMSLDPLYTYIYCFTHATSTFIIWLALSDNTLHMHICSGLVSAQHIMHDQEICVCGHKNGCVLLDLCTPCRLINYIYI